MYKTIAAVKTTKEDVISVEMREKKDKVRVYIRNQRDGLIGDETHIDLKADEFLDLVHPILQANGYTLLASQEGF